MTCKNYTCIKRNTEIIINQELIRQVTATVIGTKFESDPNHFFHLFLLLLLLNEMHLSPSLQVIDISMYAHNDPIKVSIIVVVVASGANNFKIGYHPINLNVASIIKKCIQTQNDKNIYFFFSNLSLFLFACTLLVCPALLCPFFLYVPFIAWSSALAFLYYDT